MIIKGIFIASGIAIAATSPFFLYRILPKIARYARYKYRIASQKDKKKIYNIFYRLKQEGYINVSNVNGQIYISLTKEGKKKAGKYQIDDLKIEKPEKWDKRWRILIFDIKNDEKIKREALRGKIKELGLYQLQKSVWVCPYNFQKEMNLLRLFFGLTKDEMKVIVAFEIEDDQKIRAFFKVK